MVEYNADRRAKQTDAYIKEEKKKAETMLDRGKKQFFTGGKKSMQRSEKIKVLKETKKAEIPENERNN